MTKKGVLSLKKDNYLKVEYAHRDAQLDGLGKKLKSRFHFRKRMFRFKRGNWDLKKFISILSKTKPESKKIQR